MTLRLHVATTGAKDPRLFVGVEKWSHGAPVPFNGSYGYGRDRVAQGRLRLALRELDPELSTPHQPEHTFRTLQPVRDNEKVEVLIPLSSSATLFRAGDSLRLHDRRPIPATPQPLLRPLPHPLRTQHPGKSHHHLDARPPVQPRNPRHPKR